MALTGLTKVTNIGINTTTIPTLGGSRNTGVVTATTFVGDGSGLSNVTGSGSGVIVRDGGSLVGTAGTINFGTNLNVSAISAGIVTVTNAASATALTNLSDVTISSPSNGQVLKYNGSAFVNAADTNTTYSQSSLASGSNVNLRLTDSGGTNDDILITAGSNITFSSVSAGGFTIAASGGGGGGGLSNVVEDTTPQLGGSLDLNNKFITGSGGINVSGVVTATTFSGSFTGSFTGDVTGAASQITVADESSDTTGFVVFTNTAAGNNAPKTGSNLTFDSADGILGATKFTGSGVALTGVVTSIVAGSNISLAGGPTGIVTISSSGGGGLSLSNGTNNNVITASSATALNGEGNLTFDGTTLVLTGNQTASGSIVVGSGVTIDARGINAVGTALTAGRFHALTGSFQAQTGISNQGFYLYNGNSVHLGISYSSSANINQFRGNASGNIPLVIDDFSYISIGPKSGAVTLQYAESTKLVTDLGGVKITGVATATGFSGPLTGNVTGDVTGNATSADTVDVSGAGNADTNFYVTLADQNGAARTIKIDDGLRFNTSTNVLTAGSFVKDGGSSSQFLKADGSVDSNTYLTSGSYLGNVVEDTTPQLGGNLDLNSKNITGTGEIRVVGLVTATSAVKTWTLGSSGSSHYTFTGDGFTSATNDPDIYLERGKRYAFLNNAGGTNHPFQIRVASGGSAYTTGVTYHTEHQSGSNSASQGYITFNVPWNAPATLYYQCTAHGDMGGNIYIRGGAGANNVVGFTTFSNKIEVQSSSNTAATFKGSGGAGFINITDGDDGTLAFLGVDGGEFKVQTSGNSYSDKFIIKQDGHSYSTGRQYLARTGQAASAQSNMRETFFQNIGTSSNHTFQVTNSYAGGLVYVVCSRFANANVQTTKIFAIAIRSTNNAGISQLDLANGTGAVSGASGSHSFSVSGANKGITVTNNDSTYSMNCFVTFDLTGYTA